jgi:hypothetical protein
MSNTVQTAPHRPRPRRFWHIARWLLIPLAAIVALVALWFPLSKTRLLPAMLRTPAIRPIRAAETRDGRWRQDLAYLARELPRLHVDAFHAVDRAAFEAAVARLDADIPDLSDDAIIVRLMTLTALVGDGHTGVAVQTMYTRPDGWDLYPISLMWLEDGWYVLGAMPDQADLLGARLIAIDGTPVDAAFEAVRPVVSHDNEMQLYNSAATYLVTPAVLDALGVVDGVGPAVLDFETPFGESITREVTPVDPVSNRDAFVRLADTYPPGVEPLALQHPDDLYWYDYLPAERTIFFQYDACANMEGDPFTDFNARLFEFVDSHDVDRIVVDLRANSGGNSTVLDPFLDTLAEHPDLDVVVLIGRQTFSSALMNAVQLDRAGAVLVGEPTGGRPNHYGEIRRFTLPNSGIPVVYATRYFRMLDDADPPSLDPDIPAPPTIADKLTGHDAALTAALSR